MHKQRYSYNKDCAQAFRRARAYICAYYSLYESKRNGDDTSTLTLPLIEHLVKAFKTHRAATGFDAGFVNGFVPVIKGV